MDELQKKLYWERKAIPPSKFLIMSTLWGMKRMGRIFGNDEQHK